MLAHNHKSQMLLWLDYRDLESSGMKCLDDNNRKQIKSPKKEIKRNEKQKELPGKMKEEGYNLTPRAEPAVKVCLAVDSHPDEDFFFSITGGMGLQSLSAFVHFWDLRVKRISQESPRPVPTFK